MEFRILGPLEVHHGDRTVRFGAAKERALLALLLLEANSTIPSERLIDQLWFGDPPDTAATSLRVLVSRLRKALAQLEDREVITTRPPGYAIVVDADEVDALRFERWVTTGRARLARNDAAGAARALAEALELWRGDPLGDIDDIEQIRLEASRLREARTTAIEDRIEADLALGRPAALVPELEALTKQYPTRERIWGQLMRALYGAGRQSDALAVGRSLRAALDAELGILPSSEIVALENAIIRQDPSLAGPPAQPGERHLPTGVVTFLLTDIVDSTVMWDTAPTAMDRALTRHNQLIESIVTAHDGYLLRQRGEGDSTFSVFARATDAAEAALDVQSALLAEGWQDDLALRVRISVTTGEAIERDGDYVGTTVNRAARIRSAAQPSQIVVSRSAAEVIVDHVRDATLIELGERTLRGLTRPERMFELRRGTTEPTPHRASSTRDLPATVRRLSGSVFVGRDDLIAQLRHIWDKASASHPTLVALVGEPGIGKTRLAVGFADMVHGAGGRVLFGRCDEDGAEPFQPFAEALRTLVEGDVVRGAGELSRLFPDLAERLGPNLAPHVDDPEVQRRTLFDAVAAAISASPEPVLLIIDDLHWASLSALLMLRHVMRSVHGKQLVVVTTYRDTEVDRTHALSSALADLRRETELVRIAVDGLDHDGVVSYLEAASGQTLSPDEKEIARIVHARTEGNALFVVEVLRHLIETEVVTRGEDRWIIDTTGLDAAGLPEGVRDVITQRLTRLPEHSDRTLAIAAVIGPEFDYAVLEEVSSDKPDDVLVSLESGIRAGLIVEVGRGRYAFTHALVRQTLYDELLSVRRTRLHRQIGESIESRPDTGRKLEELAHHFTEAALDGQVAKAVDYSLAAGWQAYGRVAREQAIRHGERGLAILELAPEPDHARAADLYLLLAESKPIGTIADAVRSAAIHVAHAGGADRLLQLVSLSFEAGNVLEPNPVFEAVNAQALREIDPSDGPRRAIVVAYQAAYMVWMLNHGNDGVALAEDALRLARASGDPSTLGTVLRMYLMAHLHAAEPQHQMQIAEELLGIARDLGDLRMLVEAVLARLTARLIAMDVDGYRQDASEMMVLSERMVWDYPGAFANANEASLAIHEGRFAEAIPLQNAMTALGDQNMTIGAMGLSMVQTIAEGRTNDVAAILQTVKTVLPAYAAAVPPVAALMCPADGDIESARASLAASLDVQAALDLGPMTRTMLLAFIIEACARTGYAADTAALIEPLERWHGYLVPFAPRCGVYGPGDHFLGMAHALLENWDEAEEHFEAALEQEERIGYRTWICQTSLWHARMLIDSGRDPDRAAAMLVRARDLAAEIGMQLVERDARYLLSTLGER